MTFPDPLNVKAELAFGADLTATPDEWSWTDVSDRLKVSEGVGRERGRPDESGRVNPSRLTLVLENDDGAFTPGNAASPHYPNVRRGVPVRVSLPDDAPDPKTLVADAFDRTIDGGWGSPDTGVEWQRVVPLGDEPDAATPSVDGSAGLLTLDGTPNVRTAMVQGTSAVDADHRVTVGLNGVPTGTDEHVQVEVWTRTRYKNMLRFHTDGSIFARLDRADGVPSLGAVMTSDDTTVIASLIDTGLTFTGSETYEVRVQAQGSTHRFRIWESGTSEPGSWLWEADDDTYPAGVLALALWTGGDQTNDPLIASFDDLTVTELAAPPLFLGQVVEWAPQWPSGDIGDYSRVRLVAGGVLRQQGQRQKQVSSSMTELISSRVGTGDLVAYWPCEDGVAATRMASGLTGGDPLAVSGDVEPAASAPLSATEPLPRLNDGDLSGPVSGSGGDGMLALFDIPNSGLTDDALLMRMDKSEEIDHAEVRYRTSGGGQVQVTIVDSDDNSSSGVVSSITGGLDGGLWIIGFYTAFLSVLGNTVSQGHVYSVAADGTRGDRQPFSGASASVTNSGDITSVTVGGGLGGAVVGHVAVSTIFGGDFPYDLDGTTTAFAGESAVERFARLCRQADIPAVVTGNPSLSELMGPQQPGLVLDLLRECVEVDSGIMSELNTRLGLGYRAQHTLYNQTPALTLDASASPGEIQNPFEPVLNDLDIVNDVTVSRRGGSSARVLDQDSIDAEGRYDEQVTLNAHTDSQLEGLASWRLHLGTWPGMRYPTLSPALSAVGSLIPGWVALDLGDKIRVEGLPSQHPAGAVDLLVQGTSDTLTPTGWDASGNMSPAGPYDDEPGMVLDGTGDYASTPDHADFHTTQNVGGDFVVTVDAIHASWDPDSEETLAAQYDDDGVDQRAWRLALLPGGLIRFRWSEDGVTFSTFDTTVPVPARPGERLAVRGWLNVDNGGDHSAHVYTAPTSDDTFDGLESELFAGSTTSVFDSSGDLEVGARANGRAPWTGRILKMTLWDGNISGGDHSTGGLVADPDFSAQDAGTTSFVDSTGKTWTLQGDAHIVNI